MPHSKRIYDFLLHDMLDSIRYIFEFVGDLEYEDFCKDHKTVSAVVRQFEIIGEASSRIPENFKNNIDSIPWRDMKDFRNVIIHKYWEIDYEVLWDLIKDELPDLEEKLSSLLK